MNTAPSSYTVLIIGLGALGTVFAAFLKKAGHTVFALTREKYLASFTDCSISVSGIWGEHQAALDGIYSSVDSIRGKRLDIIIVTVKSYDTQAAIEQVKPLVDRKTLVISAQNGYGNYEMISGAVGQEHTLLARIIFGAKLRAQGKAEVTVIADDVRIGQPQNAVEPFLVRQIAETFSSAGIPTRYASDIEAILWDKILYNSALNPLGAILECSYGQLADNIDACRIMNAVIDEIFNVAKAHRIPLNWKTPEEYRNHFYAKLVPPTASHLPSMHYDAKAGKRLEIDALNGAIVRLAREKGIAVPVNEAITGIIKAKETLSRK